MIFDFIPFFNPGENIPFDRTVAMMRQQTALAEQAGFTTVWVTEHHFAHDGYLNASPNAVLSCADLAAHHQQIRVGMAPVVLPDKHPLRVAEDIALLDNMTGGRVDFGAGRGNNERSSIQFHPDADRRDDDRNYALFLETLDIIVRAWTEDPFRYKGDFYEIPVPGWYETNTFMQPFDQRYYGDDGEYLAMGVHPKPKQAPHPPVWLTSDKIRAYEFAAQRGYNVLCNQAPPGRLIEGWTAYRDMWKATHGEDLPLGHNIGLSQVVFVGASMEHAERLMRPAINKYWGFLSGARAQGEWSRKWYLDDHVELTEADKDADWFDFLTAHDVIWVGDADHVGDIVERHRDQCGLQRLLFLQQFPGVEFGEIMASMDRFADEVMPRFSHPPRNWG